jgi:hypothetical protein
MWISIYCVNIYPVYNFRTNINWFVFNYEPTAKWNSRGKLKILIPNKKRNKTNTGFDKIIYRFKLKILIILSKEKKIFN